MEVLRSSSITSGSVIVTEKVRSTSRVQHHITVGKFLVLLCPKPSRKISDLTDSLDSRLGSMTLR